MNTPSTYQRLRKTLLIIALFSFPVTINYLSPYIIVVGAIKGVVNGSLLLFALLFVSSLVVGRAWCGWLCPGGGVQELCRIANDTPAKGGKYDLIKYGIWIIWLAAIVIFAIRAGGYQSIDPFLFTEGGISTLSPGDYIRFYAIAGIIVALALIFGRRALCHYVCWMAPFMVLGTALKNRLKWPSLHLKANTDQCINCKRCNKACPMSLPVNEMVQGASMRHSECILCGECVEVCPKDVIHYTFLYKPSACTPAHNDNQ